MTQYRLKVKKTPGAVVRLVGAVERRGHAPQRVNATADQDWYHVSLEVADGSHGQLKQFLSNLYGVTLLGTLD